MDFTGERFIPELTDFNISYEHWHRYLYANSFVKNKRVLDIACGEGFGTYFLSTQAKAIIGVDIDLEVIKYANQNYSNSNLQFINGSAMEIPINITSQFDVIISFETIEHITENDQIKFLSEVKRLLKPNGIFIVSTPDKLYYSDIPNHQNRFHLKEFYRSEFESFLNKSFKHTSIVGQQIHTASYISDPLKSSNEILEFNLKLTDQGFLPSEEPKKDMYMIAICSDEEIIRPKTSIIFDPNLDYSKYRLVNQTLFYDVGNGYNSVNKIVRSQYISGKEYFEITFNLSNINNLQGLRFEPCNNYCSIRIKNASLILRKNEVVALSFSTNAFEIEDGVYNFNTDTPQINFSELDYSHAKELIINLEFLTIGLASSISILQNQVSKSNIVIQDLEKELYILQKESENDEKDKSLVEYKTTLKQQEKLLKNKQELIQQQKQQLEELQKEFIKRGNKIDEQHKQFKIITNSLQTKTDQVRALENDIQRNLKELVNFKKSLSFKLSRMIAAPVRFIFNLIQKTKNKEKALWFQILIIGIKHPISFIKNFNIKNLKTLSRAINKEDKIIIYENFKNLITKRPTLEFEAEKQRELKVEDEISVENYEWKLAHQIKLLNESELFNEQYYLKNNSDVKATKLSAVEHFLSQGWKEGKNPSKLFNTSSYLLIHPELVEHQINPLLHFILMDQNLEIQKSHYPFFKKVNPFEEAKVLSFDKERLTLKAIAFYLPQFHPIPENDKWWGKNFTEWTNVTSAKSLFNGHYQPHLPHDLGFYDLRIPEIMKQQIDMAKSFGISGFCFYKYWFDGKSLLEKPLEIFLQNPDWDIKFCLCWANENWTRRWDGQDKDILIEQNHSPSDDLNFIKSIKKYLCDERYIRIDNKPIIIIYRPSIFPNIKKTIKIWRGYCLAEGIGEIKVGMAQTFGEFNPKKYNLDFAVEFPPHNFPAIEISDKIDTSETFKGHIYDGESIINQYTNKNTSSNFTLYKTVMMNWDNTARKKNKASLYLGISPNRFKGWLTNCCAELLKNNSPDNRLVFINAWNEWAEGTHLEPCSKYGYAYLNRINEVLKKFAIKDDLVSIIVPIYNGEKYLLETLTSLKNQTHKNIEIIAINDGSTDSSLKIVENFASINSSINISIISQDNLGAHHAINNAMKKANGEIVTICNHDDNFKPTRIETLLFEMALKGSQLVFSKVETIFKKGSKYNRKEDQHISMIRLKQDSIESFENIGYALLDYNVAISTGNLLFTKELWKKIGGFTELKYCHDWMFALQSLEYTIPCYVAESLYQYRIHKSNSYKELDEVAIEESKIVLNNFFKNKNKGYNKELFKNGEYFTRFVEERGYTKYF